MNNEDKELLLQDLCARLPYGVVLKHISTEKPFKLFSIKRDEYTSYKEDGVELAVDGIYYDWVVNNIYHDIGLYVKPYLRPMSSMTEEEKNEYFEIIGYKGEDKNGWIRCDNVYTEWGLNLNGCNKLISWLDKNHFDHRTDEEGKTLIDKGLAIEAPNGMYEINKK